MSPPRLVVLDVNETLSDLAPMRGRFADVGLDEGLAATWFAATLRDGLALATLGRAAPFAELASDALRDLAPSLSGSSVSHVLDGFTSLDLHADVAPGLRRLAEAGTTVVTLSNGAAEVAEGLLDRAGCRELVDHVLTVEDVGVWKPHPAAYAHALEVTGVAAPDACLVAVHPWDLAGAAHAGLRSLWIRRGERTWPASLGPRPPCAAGLDDAASTLLAGEV